MKFKVFGFDVSVTAPKLYIRKIYRPGIYVFWDSFGNCYWDFMRSYDLDTKSKRKHQLFGPFDSESSACADWLKGCNTHGYKIPWPVIVMGNVAYNCPNFIPIRGSWDNSDGVLRTHG